MYRLQQLTALQFLNGSMPTPLLHPSCTHFCGAPFFCYLDINCAVYSPRGLLKERWRMTCKTCKISSGQLFTTLHYSMYGFCTWTLQVKSLPETCDPKGRLRFRKNISHYVRITYVALYRASGKLKNGSTENRIVMLNPSRVLWDSSWREKANPTSPD